jgi:hypothetical protein
VLQEHNAHSALFRDSAPLSPRLQGQEGCRCRKPDATRPSPSGCLFGPISRIQIGMFRPIRVDHTNCLQVAIKTHSFFLRLLEEEGLRPNTYPGDTHANLSRLLANLSWLIRSQPAIVLTQVLRYEACRLRLRRRLRLRLRLQHVVHHQRTNNSERVTVGAIVSYTFLSRYKTGSCPQLLLLHLC